MQNPFFEISLMKIEKYGKNQEKQAKVGYSKITRLAFRFCPNHVLKCSGSPASPQTFPKFMNYSCRQFVPHSFAEFYFILTLPPEFEDWYRDPQTGRVRVANSDHQQSFSLNSIVSSSFQENKPNLKDRNFQTINFDWLNF